MLVGNVLVLVLGTSVLETSLPIINPNSNLNAIACSNVMVYRHFDIVYTSRDNKTANMVHSRLDYCNVVFAGLPACDIQRLQSQPYVWSPAHRNAIT